ncbi:hypothetical protein K466DRAFT_596398 [Polyporus arcularius HHB13444]|uniref:Uncharacterized protein n=1 Tax=Polyporus arcularius HHB13444 TaxID=1314778 RepID=A0A5C3PRX7_9APHY|nr:hypothetical protein K466DRAFT_596398 [Polyporus arcularius HHB13444]
MSSSSTPTPTTNYPPSSTSIPCLSSSGSSSSTLAPETPTFTPMYPTLPPSISSLSLYPSASSAINEKLAQANSAEFVTDAPEELSELSDDLIRPYCWRDIYGDESNRQQYIVWVKDHPPFVRLPAAYILNTPPPLRNPPKGRLPLLHYGIALTTAELMKFALKCTRGRIDLDAPRAAFVTAQYLSKRTKLAFKNQRPLSLEYSFVMSVGTNRDMQASCCEQNSVELAKDLREVLGVERQLSFRWWWDRNATDLSGDYLTRLCQEQVHLTAHSTCIVCASARNWGVFRPPFLLSAFPRLDPNRLVVDATVPAPRERVA